MTQVRRRQLSIETLAELDNGIVALALLKHLQIATRDCIDRPGDKSPRKVTMEFSVIPEVDQSGEATEADVNVEIKSKVPVNRSKTYKMGLSSNGLIFNVDIPTELHQPSLYKKESEGES